MGIYADMLLPIRSGFSSMWVGFEAAMGFKIE